MTHRHRPLDPALTSRLILDTEPYLSCDDCFALVDEHVEALLAGRDDPHAALAVHLVGCPACAEEATTLLLLAAEDAGVDPRAALGRLGAAEG